MIIYYSTKILESCKAAPRVILSGAILKDCFAEDLARFFVPSVDGYLFSVILSGAKDLGEILRRFAPQNDATLNTYVDGTVNGFLLSAGAGAPAFVASLLRMTRNRSKAFLSLSLL